MTSYRPITLPEACEPLGIADQPSPMLQWVEIAQMVIDESYQRPINHNGWRVIRAIAVNFRWDCFTPVMIAPIQGGKYAVIDGQHRVHAALMCGIEAVPAMVVPIAATRQAAAFIQVNSARTAMSQFNLFSAGLAAGAPWALAADQAVTAAGCRLMRFAPQSKFKKAGDILCVGLVRQMVDQGFGRAVTVTLTACKALDTGTPGSSLLYSNWLLTPLIKAVAELPELEADQLTDLFQKRRPFVLLEAAERRAAAENRAKAQVAREMFVSAIRAHLAGAG